MKHLAESLSDGYEHVTEIPAELLSKFRIEGYRVDDEGYYIFTFGENKEYQQVIMPIGSDGQYLISLQKNGVTLTEPLLVKGTDEA
jgi:predicted  nucleic acid-binding Zn-ribbon protein